MLNDLILESFINVIKDDYDKFLESIYKKYGNIGGFTIDELKEKYKLEKLILINKSKKKIIKHKKANQSIRCKARTWGGKESVKFCKKTNKWYYGEQCTRTCYNNHEYCKTHYKQTLTNYGLTHGRIDQEPPHNHYLKYKKVYALLNNLEY